MEMAEILHQFERMAGRFRPDVVEAAVACREEVTELLRALERSCERWGDANIPHL